MLSGIRLQPIEIALCHLYLMLLVLNQLFFLHNHGYASYGWLAKCVMNMSISN